jgi:hypothetical protein
LLAQPPRRSWRDGEIWGSILAAMSMSSADMLKARIWTTLTSSGRVRAP